MLVVEVVQCCILEPNHVYVIPAVARTTHRRAITVILSGMAADRSAALAGLRESGGLN